MNIPSKVKALMKKFNTNDPFLLAACLGVEILEQPLGSKLGFYKYIKKRKFIFINSSLDYYMRKIICAHELGHAIMHPKVNCSFMQNFTLLCTEKVEIEANKFCAYLLLTDDMLKEYEGYTYKQISQATSIPVEIVKLRQAQEKMI